METAERPEWSSRVWLVAAGALLGLAFLVPLLNPGLGPMAVSVALTLITLAAITATAWALLRTRRQRRAYEQRLEAWAVERAVQEERLRIARELHDLASHGLGLMTVRASYANLTEDGDHDERRQALTDIEEVGREAISELRQMLSLLRGSGTEAVPLKPAATLDDLPEIIATAQRASLHVTTRLSELGELPAAVQATICAIIREALTNSARHAGHTDVTVSIQREDGTIRVIVHDQGPRPGWRPQHGSGHGLIGLRERVALHHGALRTEQTPAGFVLSAELTTGGSTR